MLLGCSEALFYDTVVTQYCALYCTTFHAEYVCKPVDGASMSTLQLRCDILPGKLVHEDAKHSLRKGVVQDRTCEEGGLRWHVLHRGGVGELQTWGRRSKSPDQSWRRKSWRPFCDRSHSQRPKQTPEGCVVHFRPATFWWNGGSPSMLDFSLGKTPRELHLWADAKPRRIWEAEVFHHCVFQAGWERSKLGPGQQAHCHRWQWPTADERASTNQNAQGHDVLLCVFSMVEILHVVVWLSRLSLQFVPSIDAVLFVFHWLYLRHLLALCVFRISHSFTSMQQLWPWAFRGKIRPECFIASI